MLDPDPSAAQRAGASPCEPDMPSAPCAGDRFACRGDAAEAHGIELPLTEELLDRLRAAGY